VALQELFAEDDEEGMDEEESAPASICFMNTLI
jgi:hypothetical protein